MAIESLVSLLPSEGERRIKTKDGIEAIMKGKDMKEHGDKGERHRNVPTSACSQSAIKQASR
ncbi:MAG: hypothetical protein NTX75_07610 [Proteobacteria bacterium]|nr:hypothetical protein [Pseudomonadota bacterium]